MVDIIPKQQEIQLSSIILVAVIVILIVVVGIFGFFLFLKSRTTDRLSQVTEQLMERKSPEESALQSRILYTRTKLEDFAVFIAKRPDPLAFFAFIEDNTHPNTTFSELALNPQAGKAVLNGNVPTFRTLEEQIIQLKSQREITGVDLTSLSLGEAGQVLFVFTLRFEPSFFKTL